MNNGQTTTIFMCLASDRISSAILTAVSNTYGISEDQALEEITDDGAENLLEYLPTTLRMAVQVLMARHRLA